MIIQATHPDESGLDKNAANYVPLTPISFLLRSALVYRAGSPFPMEGSVQLNAAIRSRDRTRRHGFGDGNQHPGDCSRCISAYRWPGRC